MTPLAHVRPSVIFLSGPVGAGKKTLGRALAAEIGAGFIDSDELGDPSKDWLRQVLSVSEELVQIGVEILKTRPILIAARPLRVRDWLFFRARFGAQNVATFCITLTADERNILGADRGRVFDPNEQSRVRQMLAEGYGARPFSDAIVETDRRTFAATASELRTICRRLIGSAPDSPALT